MTQTSTRLEGNNYTLDLETQTLTFIKDQDTQEEQTMSLSELVELVAWLKSREQDLRFMVQKAYPRPTRTLMHRVGAYWIGVTAEREKVKVSAQRWEEMRQERERVLRANWAYDRNEQKAGTFEVAIFKTSGEEVPNPNKRMYAPEDAPMYLVQEDEQKLLSPEFWANRADNIDVGKFAKIAAGDY